MFRLMLRQLETGEAVEVLPLLFSEGREVPDRPWVMLNMVESVDGATAVDGGATALNDADDRLLFRALRAVADVVVNGAATVRAENLGPARMTDEMARFRSRAGLSERPKMAVLSRSLDLDPDQRIFSDPEARPTIVTGLDAPGERVELLRESADIVQVPRLDGAGIVGAFGDVSVVLCEGGPTINSQLIADDVVDEINLTISPVLALGESKRLASGVPLDEPRAMSLARTLIGDRSLFLRYVRDRG